MPRKLPTKTPQTKRVRLVCPLCNGKHHASDCDRSLDGMIASALSKVAKKCTRCDEVTLGGPFCVNCTIDRALERILSNVNANR